VSSAGCGREPVPSPTSYGAAQAGSADSYKGDGAGACVAEGKTCRVGGPACCTGTCHDSGYGAGTCGPLLDDGRYCTHDNDCQSGHCQQYQCAAAGACVAENQSCRLDGDCCSGLFCDNQGYSLYVCLSPKADGQYCTADKQCASGHCQDYVCGGQTCAQTGASCASHDQCCSGWCDLENAYLPSWQKCRDAQANGAYCTGDNECQSGRCLDYTCASPTCGGQGQDCTADGDCCPGTFCQNDTYARWQCTAVAAAGTYCSQDTHCQSGQCVDYQCAP
jgi:hypothetical protein